MPIPTGICCPKPDCKGDVVLKRSQKGRIFYGCSRYPNCDFVSWEKPINTPCPSCQNPYLLEKNLRSGLQIKCPSCGYHKMAEN